jgi:tetratricopeptide (TPR) repeat protein
VTAGRDVYALVNSTIVMPGPAAPEPLSSLHQLPSPPADFTGREPDLAALRQRAEQGGLAIAGMGGVGKTALALKLAADLEPDFSDAQIYLDLKGVTPRPLSAAQAMAHVVRSFHPDPRLPESPEELAALYRSVLAGKRVLLLMDNAAANGREQVEPLLPPRGCLLVVTSRFHFHVPGLAVQDLDELPEREACDLLLRIAPRIGDAAGEAAGDTASEIARLCGRLPIALRLAGGALVERPDVSPASYVRKLEDARQRLELVEASFSLSYDLLSGDLQKRWRELAVFPASFDGEGAAAVWEVEADPADEKLGELVKGSLVEGEDGRYRLHDLARVFADSQLDEAERAGSRRRHAKHYLQVLDRADALYKQGGAALLEGLRRFDLEWENFQAGQAWAAERAEADEEAAKLCSEYPDGGAYFLPLRLPSRERIVWLESALAAARRLGNRAAEGSHLNNLGLAYWEQGDARRAIGCHERNLEMARESGDRRAEGNAHGNLGIAYEALGEPRRAIEHYEQDLQIAREIGNRRGEGNALGNLGNAYMALGEPRRAIEHHERNLQLAREIGDRRGEVHALGNLGKAHAALGEPRRAIEYYEQDLQLAREIGDRRGEANALGSLGLAYADLGDARRAVEHHEQDLRIAREIGDRRGESEAAGNLGVASAALGDLRRARELSEQKLRIAGEIGDRAGVATASWNLGLIHQEEGDLGRAVEWMERGVEYFREIGHPTAESLAAQVEAVRARLAKSSRRSRRRKPA